MAFVFFFVWLFVYLSTTITYVACEGGMYSFDGFSKRVWRDVE